MVTEQVIIKFRADGTRVVERQVANIGKRSKDSAGSVNFLKKALLGLGGVVALRAAVRTLADFEQEMSTVAAVTRATADDFQDLREEAKRLGTETRFSATEAAEGLTNLSRAGFDTQETLTAVGDTLLLAQAGAVGLSDAASLTAKTIRGFGLEASESGRVVDVLVKVANSASTNVLELGEALKFVQPVSKQLGISLETTSAALGILADNALGGSIGGTGLTKVLSTLAKGTPDLTKAIKRAGLATSDFDVASLGLTPVLENLGKLNLGVGESFKIFGDRGVKAAAVLIANASKVATFNDEIDRAGGTALAAAQVMDDNLNGAILSVKSAFEGLILSLGDLGVTAFLETTFRALASTLRFLAANVEIVAGALIGLALTAIPSVITALGSLKAALLTNPFGILAIAIGAAIGALIAFKDEIKITGDGVTTLGDLFSTAFDLIGGAFDALVETVSALFGDLLPEVSEFGELSKVTFKDIALFAARSFDTMVGVAKGAFFGIVTIFQELPAALKGLFLTAANFVIRVINDLLISFQRQANGLLEGVEKLSAQLGAGLSFDRVVVPFIAEFENKGTEFKDLGAIFGQELRAGIEESIGAEQLVAAIFEGAEEKAAIRAEDTARAAAEAAAAEAAKARTAATSAGGGRDGPGGSEGAQNEARAIKELVKALTQEGELLKLTGAEQAKRAAHFEALAALEKDGIKTGSELHQTFVDQVEALTIANELNAEKARLLAVLGPTEEQQLVTQQALLEIEKERNLTAEERNKLLAAAGGEAEKNEGFFAGFLKQIDAIDTSAQGLADSVGGVLVRGIDKASNALAEFLVTGATNTEALKAALASLLQDIAKEVIQLIIKLLIVAAIKKALGGDAFSAPGASGLQAGGFVQAGQERIVGEQGPEPFVPTQSGRVLPNQALQPAAPPNITIINSSDPDEVSSFLNSDEGGDLIMNQLSKRNKEARDVLGA